MNYFSGHDTQLVLTFLHVRHGEEHFSHKFEESATK